MRKVKSRSCCVCARQHRSAYLCQGCAVGVHKQCAGLKRYLPAYPRSQMGPQGRLKMQSIVELIGKANPRKRSASLAAKLLSQSSHEHALSSNATAAEPGKAGKAVEPIGPTAPIYRLWNRNEQELWKL